MSLRSHEAAACAVIAIGVCGVLVGSLLVESMRNGQSSAKATVSTAQSTEEVQAQTEPTQTPAPTPEPEPVVQTVHFSATGDNLIHEGIYNQAMKRFVKCFFELLTQIIVKVRKCKAQRVCVLHFQLAGSGGCFFLMKLYH